jgi:hypothetical protein
MRACGDDREEGRGRHIPSRAEHDLGTAPPLQTTERDAYGGC